MALWTIESETLTGIADAVRTQLGEEDAISVADLATKILDIGGGVTPSEMGGVEIGEFVPINNTSIFEQYTELEEVHGALFIKISDNNWANGVTALASCSAEGGNSGAALFYGASIFSSWSNVAVSRATGCPIEFDDGLLTVDLGTPFSTATVFGKGSTYKYIIF